MLLLSQSEWCISQMGQMKCRFFFFESSRRNSSFQFPILRLHWSMSMTGWRWRAERVGGWNLDTGRGCSLASLARGAGGEGFAHSLTPGQGWSLGWKKTNCSRWRSLNVLLLYHPSHEQIHSEGAWPYESHGILLQHCTVLCTPALCKPMLILDIFICTLIKR